MRIGVSPQDPSGPAPLTALREELQRAADQGFTSAWMSNIFGVDPMTALAVAGSQVPGIEVGTAVVPTYPRHPAVLAQQARTVAAAVDGRLVLGIGLSHKIVIEDMFGYDFSRPVLHMREYLAVLLPLLDGQPVSFTGTTVQVNVGLTTPSPGRVPVVVAALGAQMLRLAGEQTDGTVLWMTGPATVRDHVVPAITAAAESCASCPSASPTTPTPRGSARPGSSPSTVTCRPTGPCSTGRGPRARPTWPSSVTRTSCAPRSPSSPRRA
jgi:5,10-methylenetetrahydromethanopterin reductase